jgi:hypothetical protein
LNAANGDVTLGTSTPGTYTVTYTIAAAGWLPGIYNNWINNHYRCASCNNFLCRIAILYYCRYSYGNPDRYSRRYLFIYCRINIECCKRRCIH